jgi:hypothetical protein
VKRLAVGVWLLAGSSRQPLTADRFREQGNERHHRARVHRM